MMAFLYTDVGSLRYIVIPEIGIAGNYYIQGIEVNMNNGLINVKWYVKAAFSLIAGLSALSIEFAGGTATDGVNFGYLPRVSDLSQRSGSAWIYMDVDVPDTTYYGVISYGVQYLFIVKADRRLQIYQVHQGGGNVFGVWLTPINSVPLSTWTLVSFTHDTTTVTNDPIISINGVAQTLTESSSPAGTIGDETGVEFVIGNVHSQSNNYSEAFDGKIFDARIYNTIVTQADWVTLYNSGVPNKTLLTAPSTGLMFQAFAVRTGSLANYIDIALTGLTVRDAVFGSVGVINSSPIGRAAP